jgi:hypothetical protein
VTALSGADAGGLLAQKLFDATKSVIQHQRLSRCNPAQEWERNEDQIAQKSCGVEVRIGIQTANVLEKSGQRRIVKPEEPLTLLV